MRLDVCGVRGRVVRASVRPKGVVVPFVPAALPIGVSIAIPGIVVVIIIVLIILWIIF